MNRNIKTLFDIEIDEVSAVDRPANQHGLIAFAKSEEGIDEVAEELEPELYAEDGSLVPVEALEHGDTVFDEEGNEFVYLEDDEDDESDEDDVEKAFNPANVVSPDKLRTLFRYGQKQAMAGKKAGGVLGGAQQALGGAAKFTARNPGLVAGGTAGLAGGYMAGQVRKQDNMSLGDSVLEELSKAVTERDREEIIAKAMDEVEIAKAHAAEAYEYAAAIEDARIEDAFISKAAEYNLPVAPEVFGPILKSIAEALTDEELELIDELFSAVGDALYNEIGYVGDTDNASVLDAVDGLASEFVGKSDVSYEQAYTAMFESNPSAYDAYLAEGR